MNQYVKSVEAALRATAPFVAIPVEGHAPACVRAKLLKGALKGVSIHSVKIITAPATSNCESGRWLEIKGRAEGGVRTSCKMVVENVKSYAVWKALQAWTDKERKKRVNVITQGVLNPAERKALKLKEAIAKEAKRRNAELVEAKREEAAIIERVKASVVPVLVPCDEERRAEVIAEYSEFRACRHTRKRGAVIRWKLKQLREQVNAMTVEKREYEERPTISLYARRRRVMTGKKTILKRQKDALKYASLIYEIGRLRAQYETLYPDRHIKSDYVNDGKGYWVDPWINKRPSTQAYYVAGRSHWGGADSEPSIDELKRMAEQLRNAREDIKALTPPVTEDDEEMPVAA